MISLDDLKLMDAFKRHGSLSAAARFLNLTPPALSMRLKKLEQKLGLALIVRSSRAARLTDEGERLTNEARVLLAQIEALPEMLLRDGQRLSGRLRVAAPFGFGRLHIGPLVARFAQMHPSMQINL